MQALFPCPWVVECGRLKEVGPQEARLFGHGKNSALCSCATFHHCTASPQDTQPLKPPQLLLTLLKSLARMHTCIWVTSIHLTWPAIMWGNTLLRPSRRAMVAVDSTSPVVANNVPGTVHVKGAVPVDRLNHCLPH